MSIYDKNFTDNGYLMNYEEPDYIYNVNSEVHQFKIELLHIKPKIWRRVLIPKNYNFWDLHVAIQDAMGWLDCHLHHFEIKGKSKRKISHIGIPDFDGMDTINEIFPGWEIPVSAYFNDLGVEAKYYYDYGDGWEHRVILEGDIYKRKKTKYPVCIAGARACPPEDCGGIGGYEGIVESFKNGEIEKDAELREWLGEDWKPELFNREDISFDNPHKRWKNAFSVVTF